MKKFICRCLDCPLASWNDESGYECNHPDTPPDYNEDEMNTEHNVVGVPKWCPLRKSMLMIELMEGVK